MHKGEYPRVRRKRYLFYKPPFLVIILFADITEWHEKPTANESLLCCPCLSAFVVSKFSDLVWGQGIYSCAIRLSPDGEKNQFLQAGKAAGPGGEGSNKYCKMRQRTSVCRHVCPESYRHQHGHGKWTLQFSRLIKLTLCWKYCSWSLIVIILLLV